jgi:4-hydroxy-3-polyprenylbenzoate decarboxylase
MHFIPNRSGGHGPKSGKGASDSALLVDATLKHPVSPIALPMRDYMEKAREIWEELGLPAIAPQAPWHGYMLGDWAAEWDTYAERAMTGEWAKSGIETFSQRRGGLTPETPVRDIEGSPSE